MSAKAQRPRNRTVKLVGGGSRKLRQGAGPKGSKGGSLKSMRRALRQALKDPRNATPTQQRAIKEQLKQLLDKKDGR